MTLLIALAVLVALAAMYLAWPRPHAPDDKELPPPAEPPAPKPEKPATIKKTPDRGVSQRWPWRTSPAPEPAASPPEAMATTRPGRAARVVTPDARPRST